MEIKVDIQPEHVNETIAAAVVQSQIGQALNERINEFLDDRSFGGKRLTDAMNNAVNQHLQKLVLEMVTEKYSDQIRKAVESRMTDEFVSSFIDKAWEAFRNRF